MKNRGIWFLLFTVIALSLYVFVFEVQKPKKDAEKKSEQTKLLTLERDQIDTVSFQSGPQKSVLRRAEGGWRVAEPFEDLADNNAVEDLIKSLSDEKFLEVANENSEKSADPKIYGLDAPLGIFEFKDQTGNSNVFKISEKKNFEGNAFLSKDGDPRVLIVNTLWVSLVQKKADDFRDKRLLRGTISSVENIDLKNGRDQFTLVQKDAQWSLEKFPEMIVDQNRVRELLTMINEARLAEIVAMSEPGATQKKDLGLDQPAVELRLNLRTKEGEVSRPWSALIGASKEQSYTALISEPLMRATIDASQVEKFAKLTTTFVRDRKKPFDFDAANIQTMEYTGQLKRNTQTKDAPQFSEFIQLLKTFQVVQYDRGAGQAIFGNPLHTVKLLDATGKSLFEFTVGARYQNPKMFGEQKFYLARTSQTKETFLVDDAVLESLKGHAFFKPVEKKGG